MRVAFVVSCCFLVMCFTSSASADFWSNARDKIEEEGGRIAHQVEDSVSTAADQIEAEVSRTNDRVAAEIDRTYHRIEKEAIKFLICDNKECPSTEVNKDSGSEIKIRIVNNGILPIIAAFGDTVQLEPHSSERHVLLQKNTGSNDAERTASVYIPKDQSTEKVSFYTIAPEQYCTILNKPMVDGTCWKRSWYGEYNLPADFVLSFDGSFILQIQTNGDLIQKLK